MNLAQLTQARWFPTVTKPLVSGLLASGVVFGLHALGITDFTSNEANAAIAPLAGFLVAAVVQKEKGQAGEPEQPADFIHMIVPVLVPDAEKLLRDHPDLLQELLADAIKLGTANAPTAQVEVHLAQPVTQPPSPQESGVIR